MQLTHTADNGLVGFHRHNARGSGLLPARQTVYPAYPGLSETWRLNGKVAITGSGEGHTLQYDQGVFSADGISGAQVLETYGSGDVPASTGRSGFRLVGVHLIQAGDTLLLVRTRIQYIGTGIEGAGIHAEERQALRRGRLRS